ncbi:oleosin H2-like [Cornus florida]|uniref:oleosin H2-like n=1 Tax=Cornus florida TaxID=4283 RepID=UPI00289C4D59|nr:oleosin H2-like [Cornus florida]
MADPQHQQRHPTQNLLQQKGGPSTSQVIAVVTLLPVGGVLLFLAGLTLAGSLIGLALTTPLFLIFSPVLVPAAITIGLAVLGFLSSGAFGVTALSSFSWIVNYFRQAKGPAKETMGFMRDRAKEAGQKVQDTARS